MFNEQSIISRINEGEQFVEKNEEGRMFLDVFHLAQSISDDTEGAFDITVAPLVNAWGFGFKNGIMPTQEEVDSIRQFIGNDLVSYTEDNDGELINKRDPRIMLDCSAIAKGYGTDVVMRLLQKHNIENFMIEVGGEVVTRGINPNRTPWRIGVTKPTDDTLAVANELQTVLNVTDRAIATSGNYRNYYYKNGRKYAHTIDPKTGYPVQHSLLSATVLTDQCAIADAYATAFMVMGIEKAKEILARHPEMMAYFIYSDAEGKLAVWYSPSLEDKIYE
jgi:thiamine biosynthesis lipoprotein